MKFIINRWKNYKVPLRNKRHDHTIKTVNLDSYAPYFSISIGKEDKVRNAKYTADTDCNDG
jgi:hypothetical protein